MFLHVDLDAFFSSVEQLLDPTLAGRPVVVAGLGPRGVVCAASYEARAFGVHSAMPTAVARRRCPGGAFRSPRHDVYAAHSRQVMAILRDTTPAVEQLSIDEAFVDVTGLRRSHGDARAVGSELRARIWREAGLAASVGGASTKFLAKIATDHAKPDGLLVLAAGDELAFLHALPARELWGVGPKTYASLARLGVRTVGDVARLPVEALEHAVGRATGRHIHALAHNRDARSVVVDRETRSIGNEETFGQDITRRSDAEHEITRLGDRVASRLRQGGLAARTITLKVRFADFATITRARTLGSPTAVSTVIVATARELLGAIDVERGVRLLGVATSQLVAHGEARQGVLDLGDATADHACEERRAAVEQAVDAVRDRFGPRAVAPASLVEPRGRRGPRDMVDARDAREHLRGPAKP